MKYVSYLRVSSQRQGQSGLGVEAQQVARDEYMMRNPGELVAEFTEHESGRRRTRPELAKALALAKKMDATLIVAKLDRLARDAEFLLRIRNSGLTVVFCDFPAIPPGAVGNLIVGILALVAQFESDAGGERTKAALAAAKARGVKLGDHAKGENSNRKVAVERAREMKPILDEIRDSGITSLAGMATALNKRGLGKFHAQSVKRIVERLAA